MNKIRLDNKDFYYQVFYKKIKNLHLRIQPDNSLLVTCSPRISIKQIEGFILANESSIIKKLEVMSQKSSLYNEEETDLFGERYSIEYSCGQKRNSYIIVENRLIIRFKSTEFDNIFIEKIHQMELMKEVQRALDRIKMIVEPEIPLNDITWKTQLMKTQFGSCIPKKRIIKLNSILARFPRKYLDAILIHEIIHLKVHNHQKQFYDYVNRWIPNYRTLKKELNKLSGKYVI